MLTGLPLIEPGNRVAFMGPTGSGKTELARSLLKTMRHVIVIDPKHQWEWKDDAPRFRRTAYSFDNLVAQLREIEEAEEDGPVVYCPPTEDLMPQNIGRLDRVYSLAFARGCTNVYNDELIFMAGVPNFERVLPGYFRCTTNGRTKLVSCLSSFQRPARIPLIALTETDVRVTFYFRMDADRKRAEELCGPIDWDTLRNNDFAFVWATDKDSSGPTRLQLQRKAELIA